STPIPPAKRSSPDTTTTRTPAPGELQARRTPRERHAKAPGRLVPAGALVGLGIGRAPGSRRRVRPLPGPDCRALSGTGTSGLGLERPVLLLQLARDADEQVLGDLVRLVGRLDALAEAADHLREQVGDRRDDLVVVEVARLQLGQLRAVGDRADAAVRVHPDR